MSPWHQRPLYYCTIVLLTLDISRSSITRSRAQHSSYNGKTSARLCTLEWHPIPRLHVWAMGCLSRVLQRKITAIYRERTVFATGPCLSGGRISTICAISVVGNYKECQYKFPKRNVQHLHDKSVVSFIATVKYHDQYIPCFNRVNYRQHWWHKRRRQSLWLFITVTSHEHHCVSI